MSQLKHKVIVISMIVLFLFMFSGCTKSDVTVHDDICAKLSNRIVEQVIENYEDGNVISASDIVLDKIYYGAFSQEDTNEIFVLCKILNLPHVAGLDKTVCIVFAADTLEVVTYKEFSADKVAIQCIQASNGQRRILVSETTEYQGMLTQYILLFAIQGS